MPQNHAVDLDQLDKDMQLEGINRYAETTWHDHVRPQDYAQPQYRDKLPDYVQHTPGVSQIGALTAAASARMFEEAASAIQATAEEHNRVVEFAERIIADAQAAAKDLMLLAGEYRDKAKQSFETLESQALLTAEVSKTCAELRKKIAEEEKPA